MERTVHSQLCDHLKLTKYLSGSQYGFCTDHSCCDLLVTTIDDWLRILASARDKKLNTAVVFLDLSKAFYNVHHEAHLLCLQQAGIGRWHSSEIAAPLPRQRSA